MFSFDISSAAERNLHVYYKYNTITVLRFLQYLVTTECLFWLGEQSSTFSSIVFLIYRISYARLYSFIFMFIKIMKYLIFLRR